MINAIKNKVAAIEKFRFDASSSRFSFQQIFHQPEVE